MENFNIELKKTKRSIKVLFSNKQFSHSASRWSGRYITPPQFNDMINFVGRFATVEEGMEALAKKENLDILVPGWQHEKEIEEVNLGDRVTVDHHTTQGMEFRVVKINKNTCTCVRTSDDKMYRVGRDLIHKV